MAQTQKFQGVKTGTVQHTDGCLGGYYRGTCVAERHPDGSVTLNSGGWLTATTKTRMNQFSNEFCGGRFRVYQEGGKWFVYFPAVREALPYFDGMKV